MIQSTRNARYLLFVGLMLALALPATASAQRRFDQGADGWIGGPSGGGNSGGKNLGTFDLDAFRRRTLGSNSNNNPRGNIFNPQPSRQPFFPQQPQYQRQNVYPTQPRNVVQPNASPARSRPPAAVRSNARPPEKIAATRENAKPDFDADLEHIDAESHQLAEDLVEEEANKSITELEDALGGAADEPAVEKKLDELKQKVALGLEITDEDIDQLDRLVNLVDTQKLPPGLTKDVLKDALVNVQDKGKANHFIKNHAFPDGGLQGGFPTGPVLLMPALPGDTMVLLPGGVLMVGADGQGEIGMAEYDVRELLDVNLGIGMPQPDSEVQLADEVKSGVYLMNPAENGAEIHYTIGNSNFSMKPGFKQVLSADKNWLVRFDRGEGQGEAKYQLSEGTYAFAAAASGGWELFKQSFSVTIDNADNDVPFYFNINNSQEEVAAGSLETFESTYPILVRFDRGSGGEPAQKRIANDGANLVVAVNPQDGMWDLYPQRNFEGVARKSTKKKSSLSEALRKEKLRLALERQQ